MSKKEDCVNGRKDCEKYFGRVLCVIVSYRWCLVDVHSCFVCVNVVFSLVANIIIDIFVPVE